MRFKFCYKLGGQLLLTTLNKEVKHYGVNASDWIQRNLNALLAPVNSPPLFAKFIGGGRPSPRCRVVFCCPTNRWLRKGWGASPLPEKKPLSDLSQCLSPQLLRHLRHCQLRKGRGTAIHRGRTKINLYPGWPVCQRLCLSAHGVQPRSHQIPHEAGGARFRQLAAHFLG